jgi:pre-mRNA-processing factor 39
VWEATIEQLEQFEGGLNRNADNVAIQAFRTCYDHFLKRFPSFYGYWKKYAEKEFSISGTEGADIVSGLHRGCAIYDDAK